MRTVSQECAAMAAAMLDAELYAFARRSMASSVVTPLREAVGYELTRRGLPDPAQMPA